MLRSALYSIAFRRAGRLLLTAVLATGFLAGCAARYPITTTTPPDKELSRFNDPVVQNVTPLRVTHIGPFEIVEYTRLETNDFVLEAVYDVATSIRTVLQYDYWMTRMAETWNLNNGQAKQWGKEKEVSAWHGQVPYQPYKLTATGRDCVAFNDEWDHEPLDSYNRPTRVFFGYVCAKPGKQLSEATAARIIGSVRFSQELRERLAPVNGHARVDPVAYAEAKGSPGASTGNAAFPFDFGTVYSEDGDDSRTP